MSLDNPAFPNAPQVINFPVSSSPGPDNPRKRYLLGIGLVFLLLLLAVVVGAFYLNQRTTVPPKATSGEPASAPIDKSLSATDQMAVLAALSDLKINSVNATAMDPSGREIKLASNRSYPYAVINLTWSPPLIADPGISLLGYYVYVLEENPDLKPIDQSVVGEYTRQPSFTTAEWTAGKTYYFALQASLQKDSFFPHVNLSLLEGNSRAIFIYTLSP